MKCPHLNENQSINKGQKRIDQAIDHLGLDVVRRFLAYSLYLFGYPYDFISKFVNFSEAGIKTLIKDVNKNGLKRFWDNRKSNNASSKSDVRKDSEPIVTCCEFVDDHILFNATGKLSFKIKKDDIIAKKLLTFLFLESNIIKQQEASEILGCRRLAISQNLQKFRQLGSQGLIDNRQGQKSDYKFDSEVKAEIIKQYFLNILNHKIPTKTNICNSLSEKFSYNYSERATALHLKRMGLTDNKNEIITEIVRITNEKIDDLQYLQFNNESIGAEFTNHIDSLKIFKDGLINCFIINQNDEKNLFQIEKSIEEFQSELHNTVLKSVLKENETSSQCPNCQSSNIEYIHSDKPNGNDKYISVKTGLGGTLLLNKVDEGKCNNCDHFFNSNKDILKISQNSKFTPLAQKKICSSNRAGSYENAVKNLNELINIDINKNQVRKISNYVGEYIYKEFDELYKKLEKNVHPEIIIKKHPLVQKLKLDEKYFDKSKYFIVLAVDGGRMQLFDWIPPENEYSKAKKDLHWHENKVFRISVYDKKNLRDLSNSFEDSKSYKSSSIIKGLTSYGATNRNWKETANVIHSHLYMRGIQLNDIDVCISDGSEHIIREIFNKLFSQSTQILDYYHKNEALHKCLKLKYTDDKRFKKYKKLLWEGDIKKLISELKIIQKSIGKPTEGKRNTNDPKVIIDNFINHLSDNIERLQYNKFRKQKYPIGSGSVESAVKLFGKRVKGTEKQWNQDGGEAILHLYSFLLSEDERWEKLWEIEQPWL